MENSKTNPNLNVKHRKNTKYLIRLHGSTKND